MTDQQMDRICRLVAAGARLMIGKTPSGQRKVKLVRGPFGMLTERYELDSQELEMLKSKLDRVLAAARSPV